VPKSYASIGEKQSGDPNILKLEATTKIRPLDNLVADWRQHTIQNPKDDQQITMVVCPGPRSCPLCRKPTDPTKPNNDNARFPMSKRYGANVWDYESQSVKVLVAGPQVYDEFRTAAKMGIEPMTCDWTIVKEGTGRNTKYQVVRHNAEPGPTVTPDQLLNIAKYEAPTSVESIFDTLEKYGIDYDALPIPEFDLDEALSFVMPYTSAKGLTIEKFLDTDPDKAQWLHGQKLEQGQLGDPVFIALQTAMQERGMVPELEEALAAMPEPVGEQGPSGEDAGVGSQAVGPPGQPEPQVTQALSKKPGPGEVTLIANSGMPVNVPESSVESLLKAGFTYPPEDKPAETPTPDADTPTQVRIAGQVVTLKRIEAVKMVAAGNAEWVDGSDDPAEQELKAKEEPLKLPLPDEVIELDVGGTVVPMAYVTGAQLVDTGSAKFVDQDIVAAHQKVKDKADQHAVAEQAEAEQQNPQAVPAPAEPDDPEKPHKCPTCGKGYKSKGGLTQHINRDHGASDTPSSTAAPAAAPAAASGGESDVDKSLLERVKDKIARSPFAKDYNTILSIFESTTGKKNIMEMDDAELVKLEAAIDEETRKKAS